MICGVPKLQLGDEVRKLVEPYGNIKNIHVVSDYPTEEFTEAYYVQYDRIQNARIAKRFIDGKNFYGGSLHVFYAPELESVSETRAKLLQRRREVAIRIRKNQQDVLNLNTDKFVPKEQYNRRKKTPALPLTQERLWQQYPGETLFSIYDGIPQSLDPRPICEPSLPSTSSEYQEDTASNSLQSPYYPTEAIIIQASEFKETTSKLDCVRNKRKNYKGQSINNNLKVRVIKPQIVNTSAIAKWDTSNFKNSIVLEKPSVLDCSIATLFPLYDVEDRLKTSENELEDEKTNYFPNCDASVWMRSCKKEVIEPIIGEVIGKIPSWLKGTLLRNGPGSLQVGEYSFNHLFDSSALLHRFAIANGKVTYQCRFVQTDVYKKNNAAQRIVVTEFGTKAVPDPCRSIFQRVAAVFKPEDDSDNSMISVYPFGDEYYTFTETAVIHRIDPKTLETTGKVNVSDYIGVVNHTSHPHVMNDGTVYNLGLSVTPRGPLYNVVCFSPNQMIIDDSGEEKELSMFDQAIIVASIPSRWLLNPSYMHTFGITENYFIIIEQPLAVSLATVVSCKMKQQPMRAALKWYEKENTLIHVVSRETGSLERTFISEAFFYLHIINQFETRDRDYVVLDICCYRDAKMLDCLFVDAMKNLHKNPDYAKMFRGRPLRFVLPMKRPRSDVPLEYNLITAKTVNQGLESFQDDSIRCQSKSSSEFIETSTNDEEANKGKKNDYKNILHRKATAHKLANGSIFVKPELLCDLGCETPRLNYDSCLGREYRYFYAISSDVDLDNPGTIIKVDILEKTRRTWCEKNVYPSEPIFVPDPNGKNEDDGVVLSSIVWSDKETRVGLLILDSVTLTEIARAIFDTPGPVPKCLHGWFTLDK